MSLMTDGNTLQEGRHSLGLNLHTPLEGHSQDVILQLCGSRARKDGQAGDPLPPQICSRNSYFKDSKTTRKFTTGDGMLPGQQPAWTGPSLGTGPPGPSPGQPVLVAP